MMSSNRNVKVVKEKRGWRIAILGRNGLPRVSPTCVLKFARCSGGRSQSGRKEKKEEKKDVRSESYWNGSENRTIGTRVS